MTDSNINRASSVVGEAVLGAIRVAVREEFQGMLMNVDPSRLGYANGAAKPYLTVKEAAEFSRLAPSTIRLYIRKGQLKALKVGRRVVIARGELEKFLSLNPVGVLQN